MVMFPINALTNLHSLRDNYHYPTFEMIGKTGGVQASTLRSRYTSSGFFVQFLRKNQIFAGLKRFQLQMVEQAMTDFNKDLNPHIKQRKIDVRRDKVKQLFLPSHFIRYGHSEVVQNLIGIFHNYKKNPKKYRKLLTRKIAIQFRDYLIASLVIGNGLRASNIMKLKLSELSDCKTVAGYEGHKVISNDNYKTSTIYGEKFYCYT